MDAVLNSSKRMEAWRPIDGWPSYEASTLGRIRSWKPRSGRGSPPREPRILRPITDNMGYQRLVLRPFGKRVWVRVHELVATAFHGPRPEGKECCHCDGSRNNNCPSNLRWGSRASNVADALRHGTMSKSHLTQNDILEIRATSESARVVADRFGVSATTIRDIRRRRTWCWA